MQRAFDDATNRLARRLEAESISAPPPLRRPSRLMLTGTPAPGRLEAAAANKDLDEARALCGTAWTNRLAALLPDGWRLGPCVGVGDGERFEPPCFDRLECSFIRGIKRQGDGIFSLQMNNRIINSTLSFKATLNFLVQNEDEGRILLGRKDHWGEDHFALRPGEHFMLFRYSKYVMHFETTAGRLRTYGREDREPDRIIEAPPGLVIRSFYGRARRNLDGLHIGTYCLGLVFGPPTAVWRPGTPVRFSDAATARARAVLALADGEGPLGRLPEVLVHLVLAFAIDLFPA